MSEAFTVAETIRQYTNIVRNIYVTAGPYDIVVVLASEKVSKIGEFVVRKVQMIDGVTSTTTLICIDQELHA